MVVFNIDVKIRETGGSKAVKSGLIQIQKTADKTQKVVSRIGRRVRFNGIKRFNKELKKTNKIANSTRRVVTQLFGAIGIGLAIREVVQMSDTFQNYQNRLKLVTSSTEELASVTRELFKISNETRSAYASTAELFTRVSIAVKGLGRSQREVINFTKTLNKAVILSGTTAAEAKNGIIQLSQGLASGALRGDELRSVLEQLPAVADAIAKSMNITRGELRKMGEEGKITADVVLDAMAKAAEDIDKAFATTIPTISQSFVVLKNKVIESIGAFNEATLVNQGLSKIILFVADNVGRLTTTLFVMAAAWATVALQAKFAAGALNLTAVAAARASIAAHPVAAAFVAIAAAAAFATNAVAEYYDEITSREDEEAGKSAKTKAVDRIVVLISELDKFRRQLNLTGGDTAVLEERIKTLNTSLAIQQDAYRKATGGIRNFTAEIAKANAATDDVVKRLAAESRALRDLDVDRRIGLQLLKELAKVEKAAGVDDAKNAGRNEARIRAQLELTQASREYRKVIDTITAPLQQLASQHDALIDAQDSGAISASQFKLALIELQGLPDFDLGGKFGGEALGAQIDQMREKFALLNIDIKQQAVIIGELAAKGVAGFKSLAESVAFLNALEQEGTISAEGLKIALDELLGGTPDEVYQDAIRDLNVLLKEGRISQDEWNEEARKLGPIGKKAATEFSDGFSNAIQKLIDEANDLAAVGQKIVDVFADAAVDAIHTLVTEGSLDFKEFARSLLADIAKIIIKLLIVQALQLATGTTGTAGAAGAGIDAVDRNNSPDGRAHGGPVEAGRSYLVGEDGPEVITPRQSGTVIPNDKLGGLGQQAPPEVNINITNLVDPDEIPAAIEDGQYDKQIVNLIARNKNLVNAGLA